MVFTCLSHDIVAHETTHALLDGLHRRFQGADQPRRAGLSRGLRRHRGAVPALHHSDVLLARRSPRRAAGLRPAEKLAGLGASNSAMPSASTAVPCAVPSRSKPEPGRLRRTRRSPTTAAPPRRRRLRRLPRDLRPQHADLFRLATGGTRRAAARRIHPDLVNRLAEEAGKSASHVLHICIRALDYCPPWTSPSANICAP